nr:MAG TPA: hypothetical protein [Caudoviricetes sp.]
MGKRCTGTHCKAYNSYVRKNSCNNGIIYAISRRI